MNLFRDLDSLPEAYRGGVVTIGNFDGVHQGHAAIVGRLKELAHAIDGPALAFTFDPHPGSILRPGEMPAPLTRVECKAALLLALGVDAVVAYPTDTALLRLTPGEFFQQIIRRGLQARALVEGPDFRFGRDREGTIDHLRSLAEEADMRLEVVAPVKGGDEFISSSRIRRLLAAGDVETASRLLARPYRVEGVVARGAGRGAELGFATANLESVETLIPGHGVYAGEAKTREPRFPAAVHIGPNPTFGEHARKIEVHLIDFEGQLYGDALAVDFFTRLRDVCRFESVDALRAQLADDVGQARQIWNSSTR